MDHDNRIDDLAQFDAVGLAELIRQGDISPVEAVEATIGRIELLDGETERRHPPAVRGGPRRGRLARPS